MMKKSAFLLVLILAVCALCAVPAFAAGETFDLYYGLDQTSCKVGDTITLTVSLDRTDSSDSHKMYTFQDYVLFDHMYFEFVGCESAAAGINVPTKSVQLNPEYSRVSMIYYATSGNPITRPANLTVAKLQFKALAPVHSISLSHTGTLVQTNGLNDAVLNTRDVSLTIGDSNAATYAVSFSGGGNDGGSAPAAISAKAAGDQFRLPQNSYTRAGCTFTGWSDGSKTYQPQEVYTMPAAGVTFTAQWYQEPVLHTASFSGGGATAGSVPATMNYYQGGTLTLPTKSTLARTGYSFAGWSYGGKTYQPGDAAVMPDQNVTFTAVWKAVDSGNGGSGAASQTNPFTDVKDGAYYYDAVLWAVSRDVTSGTSATTFSPAADCTRGQVVTFLWRAMGSPEPKGTGSFSDVNSDAYCAKAVQWAVEQGITNGTGADTFSPGVTVTRGQFVTFLWRAAGSPAVSGTSQFTDVTDANAYDYSAVLWAAAQGITLGTGDGTTFSPAAVCSRGQIVTFLYRYLGK